MRAGSTKNIENKLAKGKKLLEAEEADVVGVIDLSDIDQAEFKQKDYEDIPELMDYNPDYEPVTEEDEE